MGENPSSSAWRIDVKLAGLQMTGATVSDCIDAVVEMLESPELWSVAAASPAVRVSLQGLLNQVHDEIGMLTPLLKQEGEFDREQLAAVIAGRRAIVERLRTVLVACGHIGPPVNR